jgi:glyoxylase-like metal-dependent hydrolase (beta-lactamase superfamily II)
MSTVIPYVREFDFDHGQCDQVTPLVRRVICKNPGSFTFTGTGTYILGTGNVAVIDPGPVDFDHFRAIMDAVDGETITHILITHTHMDHSPLAKRLKDETGAPTYGFGPHGGRTEGQQSDEGSDWDFTPDHTINHGDIIEGGDWSIECVHTPGHTSNHICFALREEKSLFTGDHVMGWSTSIVAPPDGDMHAYFNSLTLLLDRDDDRYWPTHGTSIDDPKPFVKAFIAHRQDRENQIIECIKKDIHKIKAMVEVMYIAVDKRLYPAAARSVLSHMIHMIETNRVKCDGDATMTTSYHLPT